MTTVLSVLLVAIGLFYTNAANRVQQDLTRQGQVTERFTRAIDQLGSDKLDVRVGGIYTLKRLMRDSPGDQFNILDVLCTFVRTHAPSSRQPTTSPSVASGTDFAFAQSHVAADIQAALYAVGDHTSVPGKRYGPDLSWTDLQGADLAQANLEDAFLVGTNLSGAAFVQANLRGAFLLYADLHSATLFEADLSGARVDFADLTDAELQDANLSDVDLTPIYGLTQTLIECAKLNDGTILPAGMERPSSDAYASSTC